LSTVYYAHSKNKAGNQHLLLEHLQGVSRLAGACAEGFLWPDEARLAGLLRDLGKYGDRFQARLRGEDQGLDHWSQGAWLALSEHMAVGAALAIQGHHIGLQYLSKIDLGGMQPEKLAVRHPFGLALSHSRISELKSRLSADGILPAKPGRRCWGWIQGAA
jgi:CRISPR-associated endonuclease/helicase Cas3